MTEPGSAPGGERIGAYEIQGPLGRGGMGEVLLAWDNRLQRRVAIKRIRHDRGFEPILRQRLLREARAVAGLSHPCIVQVHDLIEDAEGDCIVLEYVEGPTLAAVLDEAGPLEPAAAVRLAGEIAGGLAAAHAAGIVHRDLKTENVIVTSAGHAKILDFGLARVRFPAGDDAFVTQRGLLLGTFHTMSPEQASGEEADERSDLFSLGVLLYEMLTGRSPFRGANPTATLKRVLSENPPRVDAVRPGSPGRLARLVERLLAKEPADRPASASEVVRELEAVAALLASSATPALGVDVSELPTVVDIPRHTASRPVPSSRASGSAAGLSIPGHPGNGKRKMVAALLATAVLGGVLSLVVQKWRAPAVPLTLRVVVLKPSVNGHNEHLSLAALAVQSTFLSTLGSLEHVDAIVPSQLFGASTEAKELTQANAANEALTASLEEVGGRGKITLTRLDASGRQLWHETINASIENGDLLRLAQAVEKSLLRGYNEHLPPSRLHLLDARPEDYFTFLTIQRKLEEGSVTPSQDDLDRLQQVVKNSPLFLDARLLAADVLLSRFQATHKKADLDQALELVPGAFDLARHDPRPLFTRFRIEIAQDRTSDAAKDLKQIEKLRPHNPQVLVLQSSLAERTGRLDEAIQELKSAVAIAPTWQDLNHLAYLEAMSGHVEDARIHLKQILVSSPNNIFALDRLAEIELLYGDLQEAERRYRDLIARAPAPLRAHYTNLGNVLFLQHRYEEAIQAFNKAMEISPDHADVNLNLAEAELALGRRQEAEAHCQNALQEIKDSHVLESRLTQAQCLAILGQSQKAVEILRKEKSDAPNVLTSEAMVYALVGERLSARAAIEQALQKGVRREWFLLPDFDSLKLKEDPEFIRIMNETPEALH